MTAQMPLTLAPDALDKMMPMHAVFGPDGRLRHAGPTLVKIHPGRDLVGRAFGDIFEARRAGNDIGIDQICARAGRKFHLRLMDPDRTQVLGTSMCLGAGQGVLINLSFGISIVDAVARFNLAGSDFAATDLTVEMLYLYEAKSAAMSESRQLNDRLNGARAAAEAEALADTLTGLKNRRALDHGLHRLISRNNPFALMHLDLDYFKKVNDTLGHAAGDKVLKVVARVLIEETREDDAVARVGGDEFVLVFNGLTDQTRLAAIADRIIRRLEEPIDCVGETARISASIGLVCSTLYPMPDAGQMMGDADLALYASKDRGRACHTFYTHEMGQLMTADAAEVAHARAGQ